MVLFTHLPSPKAARKLCQELKKIKNLVSVWTGMPAHKVLVGLVGQSSVSVKGPP